MGPDRRRQLRHFLRLSTWWRTVATTGYTVASPAIAPLQPIAAAFGQGFEVSKEGVIVPRGGDRDARDSGQWGTALRWLGDDTEYGLYFMNYHSRTPNVGTTTAGLGTLASIPGIVATANRIAPGSGSGLAQSVMLGRGQYYLEYPEDIRLYGASFSTTLPTGTAWSGEISYRPNAPVQVNTTDLTLAMLNPIAGGAASPIATSPGADNKGYRRKEVTQIQSTLTHFFDQVLGADRLTLVGEAAVVHVGGLEGTLQTALRPRLGVWPVWFRRRYRRLRHLDFMGLSRPGHPRLQQRHRRDQPQAQPVLVP